jgi:N-acyl-D-glutamate deacylase
VTTGLELESGVLGIADFYDSVVKEGRPINYGASSSAAFARIAVLEGEKPVPLVEWFFDNFANPDWQKNLATDDQINQIVDLVE